MSGMRYSFALEEFMDVHVIGGLLISSVPFLVYLATDFSGY